MIIKVKANFEKIENGFIVSHNGTREFHRSIADFVAIYVSEDIADFDKMIKEHETYGCKYKLSFSLTEKQQNSEKIENTPV